MFHWSDLTLHKPIPPPQLQNIRKNRPWKSSSRFESATKNRIQLCIQFWNPSCCTILNDLNRYWNEKELFYGGIFATTISKYSSKIKNKPPPACEQIQNAWNSYLSNKKYKNTTDSDQKERWNIVDTKVFTSLRAQQTRCEHRPTRNDIFSRKWSYALRFSWNIISKLYPITDIEKNVTIFFFSFDNHPSFNTLLKSYAFQMWNSSRPNSHFYPHTKGCKRWNFTFW